MTTLLDTSLFIFVISFWLGTYLSVRINTTLNICWAFSRPGLPLESLFIIIMIKSKDFNLRIYLSVASSKTCH